MGGRTRQISTEEWWRITEEQNVQYKTGLRTKKRQERKKNKKIGKGKEKGEREFKTEP